MELIDLTTWDRALHYQIFRNSAQPQYCVSFELDITNFLTAMRKRGIPLPFPSSMPLRTVPTESKNSAAALWMASLLCLTGSTRPSRI